MKEPTKKTKSIPQNQIPEQDESDGDDEEINKLVQSSINLILPPAIQISNEKAFQNLTHKLTKSGATSQRKLQLYDNDESSSIKVTGNTNK